MGSTKKHKKQKDMAKKHKHRSRSRSKSPGDRLNTGRDVREKEQQPYKYQSKDYRSNKKHKTHRSNRHSSPINRFKTDREVDELSDSSDVIEVPIEPTITQSGASSPIPESGAGASLSVQETNKLRAKLGLKPLDVETTQKKTEGTSQKQTFKDEWGEFYHKPAENAADKLQAQKIREKIKQRKVQRLQEDKLYSLKKLGESDDVDDIEAWIHHSRDKEKLILEAERRAKILEEMDADISDSNVKNVDSYTTGSKAYRISDLKGLKVAHDINSFDEGKSVILTLKDQDVLNDESDVLVNVNMMDEECWKKNVQNKKSLSNKYGYNVYDDAIDELGQPIRRDILSKYDEELNTIAKPSFIIGNNKDQQLAHTKRLIDIKTKLARKQEISLNEPIMFMASDTYSAEELIAFKKPRKRKNKKKIRQVLKPDDLLDTFHSADVAYSANSTRQYSNKRSDEYIKSEYQAESGGNLEDGNDDLQQMLAKARRLKQKEKIITKAIKIDLDSIKTETSMNLKTIDEGGSIGTKDIVLNATAEFCRTLGDIPTYGMSGNRDTDVTDVMDYEKSLEDEYETLEVQQSKGSWNSIDPDVEITEEEIVTPSDVAILDEEPDVGLGVGAALKLALSKGYLEKEETNRPSNTRMAHLQAKNYSIEDKAYNDDDKLNRRDRYHTGPISDFKERETYKPNVKLEYIDDNGRILNEKEAFRYLSHKFHGKGPGKNKIEKRLKKNEQDGLMMKMSSTDTPLGTLTLLQHKQKETHSPYIVLSGSKQTHISTRITKQK